MSSDLKRNRKCMKNVLTRNKHSNKLLYFYVHCVHYGWKICQFIFYMLFSFNSLTVTNNAISEKLISYLPMKIIHSEELTNHRKILKIDVSYSWKKSFHSKCRYYLCSWNRLALYECFEQNWILNTLRWLHMDIE